jgi:hypothetical protein
VTAGRITLVGSDSAEVNDTELETSPNGNPPIIVLHVGFDHVVRTGNTLVLTPTTSFAAVDTATLQGNQLVVRHHTTTAPSATVETQLFVAQ